MATCVAQSGNSGQQAAKNYGCRPPSGVKFIGSNPWLYVPKEPNNAIASRAADTSVLAVIRAPELRDIINETIETTCPHEQKRQRQKWISDDTINLIYQRNPAKLTDPQKARDLNKQICKKLKSESVIRLSLLWLQKR